MEWTEPGRAELERYLEEVRLRLSQETGGESGDPDEVVEDMRRHVHEELSSRGVQTVTLDALAPILGSLGVAGELSAESEDENSKPAPVTKMTNSISVRPHGFVWGLILMSIVLSVITITAESVTGMCSELFFDPIPTLWHGILLGLVPMIQIVILLTEDTSDPQKRRLLGMASGLSIGVAAYYSLLFLPILPIAVIGVAIGLGLLPMSPFFALMTSIYLHRGLRRANGTNTPSKVPGLWLGFAVGLLALPMISLPGLVTEYGMRVAASDDPEESARGVELLRTYGNEAHLLDSCYALSNFSNDAISRVWRAADPVVPADAREIYYRVTGRAFNSVEPPEQWRNNWLMDPEFAWSERGVQGGTEVAGRNARLVLASSRIDSKIEAAEATAYTEWTMTFRNDLPRMREARGQILLPPDSVVSRLTLWVDGEPREAAFAGVAETRGAYQAVVQRRRDPVLVTTSGPDRVLMQCFPVPENGGEMKVRVGITSPLQLDAAGQGTLAFPSFTERNFEVEPEFVHSLWIESTEDLRPGLQGLTYEKPVSDEFTARGDIDDGGLTDPAAVIRVARAAGADMAWSDQSFGSSDSVVVQEIVQQPVAAPSRVVLVVDGSATMAAVGAQVASALAALPGTVELGVIVAGDSSVELLAPTPAKPEVIASVGNELEEYAYVGGSDLVPALAAGWDHCASKDESVLLLVHGAQSVELSSVEALTQRMDRRSNGPRLLAVRATRGPNRVLRQLEGKSDLSIFARNGSLQEDLEALFASWQGGKETRIVRRESSSGEIASLEGVVEATRQVSRLWASDEILAARRSQIADWRSEALALAAHYQIVTPVSGAVVLETAAQFRSAGLEPGDSNRVPSVPEPEMVLLILITLGVLALSWRKRVVYA